MRRLLSGATVDLDGRGMSAVALADLDNDGAREIVVATDTFVHVREGSGGIFSGSWPRSITGGDWIDPVVADVDLDGDYEILVGENLWHHDGSLVSGWPAAASTSTGVIVPLPDGDCELEPVLGGVPFDLFSARHHDGSLFFAKQQLAPTFGVGGLGLNFDRGVPIAADVDGDLSTEILRPGVGAFQLIQPLYGSEGDNPADATNFPLFVPATTSLLMGSATVADIDGDGDTEVLQLAPNQLLVWDLPASYDPIASPWPMFQGDPTHTGTLPRRACIRKASGGSGFFQSNGQSLGSSPSLDVALADIDGDGDQDAVVGNFNQPASVWKNDGSANFTLHQSLATARDVAVVLGDFDGNGTLDLFVAENSGPGTVWSNNGAGTFSNSGQQLGNANSSDAASGDFDGDGHLDLVVANNGANEIWRNDGFGNFSLSQSVGGRSSWGVAVADIDGDGHLDLFFANAGTLGGGPGNTVWLNNGSGGFFSSGQSLGTWDSRKVALGDFDGDGDLDALVRNVPNSQPNHIWQNIGGGNFSNSGQTLGTLGNGVALGDLNGDGDLDAFFTNTTSANRVWLGNAGLGFTNSGQNLGNATSSAAALGDLDNDGDLDAFVANQGSNNANKVYLNTGNAYCVSGAGSGNTLDWNLSGGIVNHTETGAGGLAQGTSPNALATDFSSSINGAGISGVSATVIIPQSCFRVDANSNLNLTLWPQGQAPSCTVTTAGCLY